MATQSSRTEWDLPPELSDLEELHKANLFYVDYINGKLVKPKNVLDQFLRDPNTGKPWQPIRETDDENLDLALRSARRVEVNGTWRNLSCSQRAQFLQKIAAEVEKLEDKMARLDSFNTGIAISLTSMILPSLKGALNDIAAKGASICQSPKKVPGMFGQIEVERRPWGVALILAPWNVPGGSVVPKIAAALMAGAPVILKPSEWAPLSLSLFAVAVDRANLPPGVFQLVNGGAKVGQKLVSDERISCVNFTGSVANGRNVAEVCSKSLKPFMLELGGSNPLIVLPEANVEAAADAVVQGMTLLNGQWCAGVSRILVHHSLKRNLVKAVLRRFRRLKLGNSLHPDTQMGPISNIVNFTTLQKRLRELVNKGGKPYSPSLFPHERLARLQERDKMSQVPKELSSEPKGSYPPPPKRESRQVLNSTGDVGFFMKPTLVLGVSNNDACEIGELFGPVASVISFRTIEEAIDLANHQITTAMPLKKPSGAPLGSTPVALPQTPILMCNIFTATDPAAIREAMLIGRRINSGLVMLNGVGFGFETAPPAPTNESTAQEPSVQTTEMAESETKSQLLTGSSGEDQAIGENDEPPLVFSFWGLSGFGDDGTVSSMINFFTGSQIVGVNGTGLPEQPPSEIPEVNVADKTEQPTSAEQTGKEGEDSFSEEEDLDFSEDEHVHPPPEQIVVVPSQRMSRRTLTLLNPIRKRYYTRLKII